MQGKQKHAWTQRQFTENIQLNENYNLHLQKVTRKPDENTVQMSKGGEAANCVVSAAPPHWARNTHHGAQRYRHIPRWTSVLLSVSTTVFAARRACRRPSPLGSRARSPPARRPRARPGSPRSSSPSPRSRSAPRPASSPPGTRTRRSRYRGCLRGLSV